MRSLIFMLVLLCVFNMARAYGGGKCGPNESIQESGFNCNNCINARCVRCATVEEKGCFCDEGAIRVSDKNRTCVRTEDCPVCLGCPCATNQGR